MLGNVSLKAQQESGYHTSAFFPIVSKFLAYTTKNAVEVSYACSAPPHHFAEKSFIFAGI